RDGIRRLRQIKNALPADNAKFAGADSRVRPRRIERGHMCLLACPLAQVALPPVCYHLSGLLQLRSAVVRPNNYAIVADKRRYQRRAAKHASVTDINPNHL